MGKTVQHIIQAATLMALAFIQNVSFSVVSRSRNRDNKRYHVIAACFSNTIWFVTFRMLVKTEMSLELFPFYVIGTVSGSMCGVMVAMKIEQWLGATADGHVKKG